MTIDKLLLKPEEAAELLSIGRSKVYELIASGELVSVRMAPVGGSQPTRSRISFDNSHMGSHHRQPPAGRGSEVIRLRRTRSGERRRS